MNQPTAQFALIGMLLLSPLAASAYYCPDMHYTGAKALPNGGHQYSLSGSCMLDPNGLGHVKEHAIETATLSWDGNGKAQEAFVVEFNSPNGPHQSTVIEYSCNQGDPWQSQLSSCQRTSCIAIHGANVIDKQGCPVGKLDKLLPTTRNLVPALAKYTSDDPQAFYFLSPTENASLPAAGSADFHLGLRKDVAANMAAWPDKSGMGTITANLTWSGPDKIAYSAWPGQKPLLPSSITLKGTKGFDFMGASNISSSNFSKPGLWTARACIDQAGFKGCTERQFMVAGAPKQPLSGNAPAKAVQSPAKALLPDGTNKPGNGGGFAPLTPVVGKPLQRPTPQTLSTQRGHVTNSRLNPQPEVPNTHTGSAQVNPTLPAVQLRRRGAATSPEINPQPEPPGVPGSIGQTTPALPAVQHRNSGATLSRLPEAPASQVENAPGPPDSQRGGM